MSRTSRFLLIGAALAVLLCGVAAAGCLAIGVGSQLLANRPALRAADELTVTAESGWPDRVTFRVRVPGAARLARLQLWYRFHAGAGYQSLEPRDLPPGRDSEAVFAVPTSGGSYLPPGTEFLYHFQLEYADGQKEDTPEQSFVYLDTRFRWTALRRQDVTVYYHGGAEAVAVQVLATGAQTIETVGGLLGTGPLGPVRIMLYASRDEMDPAIPPDLRTTGTEFVTEGLTYQEQRVILVNPGVSDLLSNVAHEAAHLVSNAAAGPGYPNLPFWLSEGISVFAQPDNGATYRPFVLRAIQERTLLHLTDLVEVPSGQREILTGYGEAALFVRFLVERYGPERLARLVAAYRASSDHAANLHAAYGKTLAELDSEWLAALDRGEIRGYPPRPGQ